MAIGERERRRLFDSLSDVLGEEMAGVLFEHLPPPGRDVATRQQVDATHQLVEARFDILDRRMTKFEERVTGLDDRMTSLEERVTGLEERVTGLEERVTGLKEQVTGLGTQMDQRFEQFEERLTGTLTAAWRRDLLLHSTGQFFALAAAVAALVALG